MQNNGGHRLMAKKIELPFIRVHENMPEHPKVEPLSDKAFRLLLETWCWSKRTKTDGHVEARVWRKRGTAKTRAELLEAGLVEDDLTGGVIVHDYDDWQMTSDEIDDRGGEQAGRGTRGAHERWHVQRGITRTDCEWCKPDASRMRNASP
jgi:hypothetical protein